MGANNSPTYTAPPEGEPQDGTVYGSIDPELEKIVTDWRSSGTESPLFLPTYLPFPVAEVESRSSGAGQQEYYLWSDDTIEVSNYVRMILLGPATAPSSYFSQGTVTIDGRDYPPYWEGSFEKQGYTYTLSVPLADPSADVASAVHHGRGT